MSTPNYGDLLMRWIKAHGEAGEQFQAKVEDQPWLLERAVALARKRRRMGNSIISHRWLVETLRLEDEIKPLPGEEYGLSNTYGRPLALLIMALNDDLAGYIRTNDQEK